MAIAVSAWLDTDSERVVRDLWARLADASVDGSLDGGAYRPHLTLGVWDELPVTSATDALAGIARDVGPLPIELGALGIFPPHPEHDVAVWLAPTLSTALRELHERVHATLGALGTGARAHHLPGRWNPHCTLAWRFDAALVPRAVEVVLGAELLPLEATIERLGLIDTPAEVELAAVPLGAPAAYS